MADDVLVSRTTFDECLQFVHVTHVSPQSIEMSRNLKTVQKVWASHSNVLKSGDQFAVEAADVRSGQKSRITTSQMIVDRFQLIQQIVSRVRFISRQRQFEFLRVAVS